MKFSGKIGFLVGESEECQGIWKPEIIERSYTGDILRNKRQYQIGDKQNADLNVSNQISILSDPYMQQNWASIRYVIWNGVKWQVSSVDINYPRLTLELGGVCNENEK